MLRGNCPSLKWLSMRIALLMLLGVAGCQSVPVDIAAPRPTANLNAASSVLESGRATYVSFLKCGLCHRPKPVYDYSPEAWANDILPEWHRKRDLSLRNIKRSWPT